MLIIFYRTIVIKTSINTGYGIMEMGMFQDTRFLGRKVLFENVKGLLKFDCIFTDKTDFDIIDMDYPIDFGVASFGEDAYRLARIQKEKIGDFSGATNYFYLEKCYRGYQILPEPYFWDKNQKGLKKFQFLVYLKTDKAYEKIIPKFIDWIFNFSIGYGEKPSRALRMLLTLTFVFAFLYMFIDIKVGNQIVNYDLGIGTYIFSIEYWKELLRDFGNCFYFSLVTLSTVGYGDITPANGWGKFVSGVEMFLGVTFVGAWTATLLRKMIK